MNTRPDERLPYLDLARQGARVVRTVQADGLERLAEVAPGQGPMHVEMTFHLDDEGRPWVRGVARALLDATCQRCLERFDHDMAVNFELCIMRNPQLASTLAEEVDVLMTDSDAVTVPDVVEDELLLSLPERLCTQVPCPHAPAMEYPADEAEEPERDNPFQVLSELKQQ